MLKTRIIPCLDVADGRVVKGVNFVDLRDAVTRWKPAKPMTRRARMNCAFWIFTPPMKTGHDV
jgi:imidazole glycerol phosphate synthase subunit HisF